MRAFLAFISRNRQGWYMGLVFIFVFIPLLASIALWLGFRTSFIASGLSLKASNAVGHYVHIGEVLPKGFGGMCFKDVRIDSGNKGKAIVTAEQVVWNKDGDEKLFVQNAEVRVDTGINSAFFAFLERLKPSTATQKQTGPPFSAVELKNSKLIIPRESGNIEILFDDFTISFIDETKIEFDTVSAQISAPSFSAKLSLHYSTKEGGLGTVSDIRMSGVKIPSIDIAALSGGGAHITWVNMFNAELRPTFTSAGMCSRIDLDKIVVDFNEIYTKNTEVAVLIQSLFATPSPQLKGSLSYAFGTKTPLQGNFSIEEKLPNNIKNIPFDIRLSESGELTFESFSEKEVVMLDSFLRFAPKTKTVLTAMFTREGMHGMIQESTFTVDIPLIGLMVKDIHTEDIFRFKAEIP